MPLSNPELMLKARQSLKNNWGNAISACVLFFLASGLLGAVPKAGWILSLVISGPLTFGYYRFFIMLTRNENPRTATLFEGFNHFLSCFSAYLLSMIFIILWTLLLIIPGIMAALSYSMTFFILSDEPTLDGAAAIRKSKEMMYGHRYRLFCLGCRFIGWFILGILSIGIGFLWIGPYITASFTHFYENLAKKEPQVSSAGGYTGLTVDGMSKA
jgi:uncharacterized membrane protein